MEVVVAVEVGMEVVAAVEVVVVMEVVVAETGEVRRRQGAEKLPT